MNYIDILLVVPVIWGGVIGFKKGLIIEVISLLALGLGIWGGIHFSDYAGEWLADKVDAKYVSLIAFGITLLLIVICVYFIGKLLEKVINFIQLKLINKLAGTIFGAGKIALIISVLIVIVDSIDEKNEFVPSEYKDSSLLYKPIGGFSLSLIPAIKESELFKQNTNEELKKLSI